MDDWIDAVRQGGSLFDVFRIDAPPTIDNTTQLESRLGFIRDKIIPLIDV